MLDSCPNNRMSEGEILTTFYEGMTPENKDLVNSSSGGDFSRMRMSQARTIINRLVDAKRAYDDPRSQLLRKVASTDTTTTQLEEKMQKEMGRLEKRIISAIEQSQRQPSLEKACGIARREDEAPYYDQGGEGDNVASVNAAGHWNPHGSWNLGKPRNAPWRDHPNFRWSDTNQNQHGPPQNIYQGPPPQEHQSNWPVRANQPSQNHQPGQHLNPNSAYVPPHQIGHQNHLGPPNHYQNNPNHHYNYPLAQMPHHNSNHPRSNSNQPSNYQNQPKPAKSMEELVGDLVSSQQHLQNNIQSNNDVVHRMQDAQKEQRAIMDMQAKQMSQLAMSMNEMRGNEGKLPASVRMPDKANVSQITLRSGNEYKGPVMKFVESESREKYGNGDKLTKWEGHEGGRNIDHIEELSRPLPKDTDPFFLEEEPAPKDDPEPKEDRTKD